MKKYSLLMGIIILALVILSCGIYKNTREKNNMNHNLDMGSDENMNEDPSSRAISFMIEGDNYIDYQTGLECSAFASAYILRHYGEQADGLSLYSNFPGKLSDGGVMPKGIVDFFDQLDYKAEYVDDRTIEDLKTELRKGSPVIVFIHVSYPYTNTHETHYVPAVGYDEDYIYLAESIKSLANCKDEENVPYNRKVEISEFELLWDNIDGMWDYPYFIVEPKE